MSVSWTNEYHTWAGRFCAIVHTFVWLIGNRVVIADDKPRFPQVSGSNREMRNVRLLKLAHEVFSLRVCGTGHLRAGVRHILQAIVISQSGIQKSRSGGLPYMHRAHRYIASLFLTAGLAASGSIVAAAPPQEASVQIRVYDRDHRDYHNWDDREEHAYRGYLTERHENYRAFDKQKHKHQKNYWNWRHSHPDRD